MADTRIAGSRSVVQPCSVAQAQRDAAINESAGAADAVRAAAAAEAERILTLARAQASTAQLCVATI